MQEEKQKVDRKRIVGLLTISCVATLCFAGLYVKALQKERQLEEAGMLSDASELDELWTDYIAAVNRADQAEQIENNRKLVNDLILSFLDAYFILPSSREALLTGCENYVSEDAWRSVELLSENQDYGEKDRELFALSWKITIVSMMHLLFLRFERLRMVAPVIRAICW